VKENEKQDTIEDEELKALQLIKEVRNLQRSGVTFSLNL
jgi:hypothetical protein